MATSNTAEDFSSLSSVHAQDAPESVLPTSCVIVYDVPLELSQDDVFKALQQAATINTAESAATRLPFVSDGGIRPSTVRKAVQSPSDNFVTASIARSSSVRLPESLEVHSGFTPCPVVAMFEEIVTAVFTLNNQLLYPDLGAYLVTQGQKLSVAVSFPPQTGKVVVSGNSSQVYKFRQYLAKVLTCKALSRPCNSHGPPVVMAETPPVTEVPPGAAVGNSSHVSPISQEAAPEQGKSFTGLSRDVLLLMPQLYTDDRFKGMAFHPEEGRVEILSSTEEEQEKCISQFQEAYQAITKNRQLKTGDLTVPPSFSTENLFSLLEEFNAKYSQCIFSFDEKSQSIRIVSISSRQFDQAKKLISDRLMAGNSPATPTTGSQGKATGKISTAVGSSEILTTVKGRKITVKRGDIVTQDTEIIVNAANGKLDHIAGVAGALNKASQGELQKKSNVYIQQHGSVPVGGVAVTKAGGQLKCKRVIHAVGPIASQHTSDLACSELIFQAVTNALIEAQKINATSIAFPALSTGIYAVNKTLAADAIFQALQKFRYTSNKTLKDIRIVILDEPTYLVFAQHLIRLKNLPAEPAPGSPAQSAGSQPKSSGTHPTTAKSTPAAIVAKGTTSSSNDYAISSSQGGAPPPGFFSASAHVVTSQPQPSSPVVTADISYPVFPSTTTPAQAGQGTSTTVWISASHPLSSATTAANSGGPAGTAGRGVWSNSAPHLTAATNGSHAGGTAAGRGRGNFFQSPTFVYPVGGAQPTGTSQVTQQTGPAAGGQMQSLPNQATTPSNVSGTGSSQQDENFSTPPNKSPSITPPPDDDPDDSTKLNEASGGKETQDQCPICLSTAVTDPAWTNCCKQIFCKSCIQKSLEHSCYCPICKKALRPVQGNQPTGGTMSHFVGNTSLPGHEGCGTITITYRIPGGIQDQEHPNPGQRYHGTTRTAYLPNSPEGQEVLGLLRKAFDARLIFTVGTSHTTSQSNVVVWNDIHHKTVTHGQPYGYPDPSYLQRVKEELRAKGIQ